MSEIVAPLREAETTELVLPLTELVSAEASDVAVGVGDGGVVLRLLGFP